MTLLAAPHLVDVAVIRFIVRIFIATKPMHVKQMVIDRLQVRIQVGSAMVPVLRKVFWRMWLVQRRPTTKAPNLCSAANVP